MALPATVNDLKAVIWWYDRGHESGETVDDIDFYLTRISNGAHLRSSEDAWDNKERVYHSAIGGLAVRLDIHGLRVTTDVEGCGQNSMRVYWAYLYEDDARDDPEGPTSAIDPE